jgi:RNA polymerase subunit RPABC4/transcription elongation factor Spt4
MAESLAWQCENCKEIYDENPDKCRSCEHTVLQQYRPNSASGSKESDTRVQPSDSDESEWICKKCEHKHNRKPFVCEECNSSALYKSEPLKIIESSENASAESSLPSGISILILLFVFFLLLLVVMAGNLLLQIF